MKTDAEELIEADDDTEQAAVEADPEMLAQVERVKEAKGKLDEYDAGRAGVNMALAKELLALKAICHRNGIDDDRKFGALLARHNINITKNDRFSLIWLAKNEDKVLEFQARQRKPLKSAAYLWKKMRDEDSADDPKPKKSKPKEESSLEWARDYFTDPDQRPCDASDAKSIAAELTKLTQRLAGDDEEDERGAPYRVNPYRLALACKEDDKLLGHVIDLHYWLDEFLQLRLAMTELPIAEEDDEAQS
jgi:hypothetical protein